MPGTHNRVFYDFVCERSFHSEENVDEPEKLSTLTQTFHRISEQLQDGFHGDTVGDHDETLGR